ncbi:hypothetical protein ASD24_24865 [Paenibacillus sp. Root52]|uniref:hypothetical protein n=1 Tax=Paenibacillus sp. Root52 TaxID=1736552 RepID=UPI0006F2251B|nr:hypothetical protein [Paenibacillus sp. Root52]KQY91031.1 hypothetical protein ASD24_24865 [Paenibacillus sp. Root52]
MKFWTVQHSDVARSILENHTYECDFSVTHPFEKYPNMKIVYPIVLKEYRERNGVDSPGLIFGFSHLGRTELRNYTHFYEFFCASGATAIGFKFWEPTYCLLELEIRDYIDVTPIGYNDFVKLEIEANNELESIDIFNQTEEVPFYQQIADIKEHFRRGKVIEDWVVQVHTHMISKDNIVGIYPMFDYRTGMTYRMDPSFEELKNVLQLD